MKIVKDHIGFHYFLTKSYLYNLILFELNQEVLTKIKEKLITHDVFRIQDNEFITCGFFVLLSYNTFFQENLCQIILVYFLPKDCKKNDKQYLRILKINMVEEASVEFKLKNR